MDDVYEVGLATLEKMETCTAFCWIRWEFRWLGEFTV